MTVSITYLNGKPATVEQIAPLAFAGYAHFTAMQVRGRAVRGLDLHLDRLRTASDELFGRHLSDARLREHLATALRAGPADASLTCFVTARPGEFVPAEDVAELDVLIRITDPAVPPNGPLALDVVRYERHLPGTKHVGEVGKTLWLRKANARGFHDAAFEDRSGRLSEATIWNLAFWDGESVIWPEAEMLPGVTMRILRRRLERHGVPQRNQEVRRAELSGRLSAVVMNSWTPGVPIARLGDRHLAQDPGFVRRLREAYEDEPLRPVL